MDAQAGLHLCCSQTPRRQVFSCRGPYHLQHVGYWDEYKLGGLKADSYTHYIPLEEEFTNYVCFEGGHCASDR